ncbi:MAG: PAS domain-containing protein [Sneathiella sp.]
MSEISQKNFEEVTRIRDIAVDARLINLLDYYLKIHPKSRLPARADFDPSDIPLCLPNLALVDVERNPFRFRYRVMGTSITFNIEQEGTGKYLDEIIPGVETQFPHLDRAEVAETGLPIYRLGEGSVSFRTDFANLERVHLPLATDGNLVDMVLSMYIYFSDD